MVVISAVGTVAAAVAAWKAVEAVRLTREARREEQLRRLREALVGVEHAMDHLMGTIGGGPLPEAQLEVKRARALHVVLPEDVENLLDKVVDPDAAKRPQTRADAHEAWKLLSTEPPPPKMPNWYIRLITIPARRQARRQK